ncbi:MAG: hypothetical protein QOF87_186 [Pseudonocardiales bacterium]|jgi:hypothetical protein|nr:hypothetical protein [Pseudonocardiales bacterium]MDT4960539.1 hypothetical protein [Pseudonocardiales bacterium]
MSESNQSGEAALEGWVNDLADRLGVDRDLVDVTLLLAVARDAARHVTKTAAPIATFLVGVAVAQRGGSQEDVAEAARQAQELASAFDAKNGNSAEP